MAFIKLLFGLALAMIVSCLGFLVICSTYFARFLQIEATEGGIIVLIVSVLSLLAGAYVNKRSVRNFHLAAKPVISRNILIAGWMLFISGSIIILWGGVRLIIPLGLPKEAFIPLFLLLATGCLLSAFGKIVVMTSISPDASDILIKDPRPPVLYLRAFARESRWAQFGYMLSRLNILFWLIRTPSTDERERGWAGLARRVNRQVLPGGPLTMSNKLQAFLSGRGGNVFGLMGRRQVDDEQIPFASLMSLIGPYIAIARPSQTSERLDVGASRLTVSDGEWQSVVSKLIIESAAIVVEVDSSPGLRWEIEQIVRFAPAQKVLMIVPRADSDYNKFLDCVGDMFSKKLPDATELVSRFVMFRDDWTPVALTWDPLPFDKSARMIGETEEGGNKVSSFEIPSVLKPFIKQNRFQLSSRMNE